MKNQKHNLNDQDNSYVISYQQLRMFIGLLGFLLAFLLYLSTVLLGDQLQPKISISHYYYSFGHVIFVGTLCVMGGLFGTYRGRDSFENKLSNISGILAVLVAVFPTDIEGYEGIRYLVFCDYIYVPWFNYVHLISAFLLFVSFAIFCLVVFPKNDEEPKNEIDILKKKRRNRYYKICGWGIILSLLCILIFSFWIKEDNPQNMFLKYSTIIFEITSLFFFSTSWLLKSSDFWNKKIPLINYFR